MLRIPNRGSGQNRNEKSEIVWKFIFFNFQIFFIWKYELKRNLSSVIICHAFSPNFTSTNLETQLWL